MSRHFATIPATSKGMVVVSSPDAARRLARGLVELERLERTNGIATAAEWVELRSALMEFFESGGSGLVPPLVPPLPSGGSGSASSVVVDNSIGTRTAATRLGMSASYVRRLCRAGRLLAERDGFRWRIDQASLEAYEGEQ